MKKIFDSPFPQSHLLEPEKFIAYIKRLDIKYDLKRLEYYDQKGILRPVLRFRHVLNPFGGVAWSFFGPQVTAMKGQINRVEFPEDEDYTPWKDFQLGKDERIVPYYHPFQFVQADFATRVSGLFFEQEFVEGLDSVDNETVEFWKNEVARQIKSSQTAAIETWIPVVGFLILLEEWYFPLIRGLSMDPFDPDFYRKWQEWRSQFSAANFLSNSKVNVDQVKKIYDHVADVGHLRDPLASWYPLQELIKRSMKQRLKKSALLAQEYYDLSKMVKSFIKDVSGEIMVDPDDKFDSNHKNWKPQRYGDPVDYSSAKTNRLIRDHYFLDRPPFLSIIYEGETEDLLIRKILAVLGVDVEKSGYHLYNAQGSGNMDTKKLEGLIDVAKMNQMEIYLIIDNDGNSQKMLRNHLAIGNIKDGMYTIWKKDFEYDNFGPGQVIDEVNVMLVSQRHNKVDQQEVETRMSTNGDVLMRAIDIIARKNNDHVKLEDMISKPALSEHLVEPRINAIKQEIATGKWQPILPVEKVLESIFKRYPFTR